jgi:NADH-quinone oxidoreductase subunit J
MPAALFYLFTILMLAAGIGVVINRNPVASALCLVVSFVWLAALYVSLDAYLIATLQVLVYAGAVMVLFLFIIMLLDIKAEARRKLNKTAVVGGGLLVLGFIAHLGMVIGSLQNANSNMPDLDLPKAAELRRASGTELDAGITASLAGDAAAKRPPTLPDVKLVGETLFTKYTFHLQIVGVLLLVATVGVVVLSRREDKTRAAAQPSPTPPSTPETAPQA